MSLEERIHQSVETALAELRARLDADVRAMVGQLVTTASEEQAAAVDASRRTALEEAARETEARVAESEARVRATVDELVEQARATERELAATDKRQAEADKRQAEMDAEEKLQSAVASVREEMRQALQEAESRAREEIERALQQADTHARDELSRALQEADSRARDEMQRALQNAEHRAHETVHDSVVAARVGEREHDMAGVSRLLESVRGLDGATSLSEVLDALSLAAGREASRAAVLVLRNERLLGWKLHGFGARDLQPKSIDLTLADAGIAGVAIGTARPVTTRDSQSATTGPTFAELPSDRMGLAVPVIVGGRVVAVVYADGVTQDAREQIVPSSWPEVIEILARHAARCLESLTVQKAATQTPSPRFWVPPATAGNKTASTMPPSSSPESTDPAPGPEESARRFARLLLSEIKLYHEPAVDQGRRSRNLLSRLGPEIERARRHYEDRVPTSLRSRAELFHQELIATLAGGDPALLGSPA